ncbi:hypothetical protein MAUB1S_04024 [Mycolicibacterium aubagnense]
MLFSAESADVTMRQLNHVRGFLMANVEGMTETLNAPTSTHAKRIDIYDVAPELYAGMMAFSNAASKELDSTIGELIKIRASQINRCAFCLDMHVHHARRFGETEQRLALVAAWEEAGDLFTDRERAALAITEAITDLSHGPVPDEVYAQRPPSSPSASWRTSSAWPPPSTRGTD